MQYYTYNKKAQDEATPSNFQPFLRNVPKFIDGNSKDKDKLYSISVDKSSDNNKFRILPPWSSAGLMAKIKRVHNYIGIKSESLVCPESEEEGSCPFCQTVAKMRGEDKYKADFDVIRSKIRALFNVVDVNNPDLGALVFYTYSTIYFDIKRFQDSGEYGNIMDPLEGRDLKFTREVYAKGRFKDAVYPVGNFSKLCNPDALDQMVDLDTVFPPVDRDAMNAAFNSHPWKVYTPSSATVSLPPEYKEFTNNSLVPKQEQAVTTPKQEDKSSKIDDLEARIRAKMAAKNQPVAS